ncbi:hypothetical protein F511_26938 [Dorcoceras hygrometricum]|uniref:ICln family transporter: chloride ion current inducer protein I(Cln) n=1 Tax=Dorcoceras hygrometricum TaxID=472368 RepID=A0A2Z7AXV8_9LAMI|nr:hypothetical protein F511_26938 [Dorcoceras hygrometricum]
MAQRRIVQTVLNADANRESQGSTAVDIQVIELLSALHLSLLEELAKEARILGLTWTKPCCSSVFEGSPRDRGAVIARNNTNTRSLCWIRTMLMVDGVWTVEPCADKWVKIPRKVVSTEVPPQTQYDDTLPTMSVFFKLLRKQWADVCLEAVEFCAQRLLPVGSIRSCRSLQLSESVSSFAPTKPTVFAVRVSQFCSVFVDMSLFSWLPSIDISEFLSSIALDKTVLRSFQSSQESFSVAPSVQLSLEQQHSSSSSSSSSSLHFDHTDIDATASSRPTISPDLSAVFADFQAALSEQIFASQSDISSRMHKLEQSVCDSLRDQADVFKSLSQGARQEVCTLDDVHTIRFNEFRKNVLTQNATIFQGLADVRQVVDAVNSKADIMAKHLNDIQKDTEATKEALSHQLLEFQSSAQENHNVIHAQLSELVDYIHRGSADKKGESGSRGLQKPANTQKEGSAVTLSFEQRVQMAQRRIVQTVLDADANRESQAAAERDRERRRKEAKSLKRRRSSEFSSWERFSRYFIQEHSADVSVSTSEYRIDFQRVFAKKSKRQRFDKLERRRGMHSFVSADEVISRSFLQEIISWLSLFVESCDTTAFGLVGTTAFGLIQQKRSFDISAGSYSDFNQQMLYLVLTSRCISMIAKRRHLIKLTRHRFIAKGISRWKNAYAYQQMNSSKRFSSRSY